MNKKKDKSTYQSYTKEELIDEIECLWNNLETEITYSNVSHMFCNEVREFIHPNLYSEILNKCWDRRKERDV